MNNFPEIAKNYFEENKLFNDDKQAAFFLVRPDGVPIYRGDSFNTKINEASIGALLAGVWQAAKALSSFLPDDNKSNDFRLSFDTSSQGVYILPVKVSSEEYYLGVIFKNEMNPGQLKSNLRNFISKFNLFVEEKILTLTAPDKLETKSSLFNEISDEEMDNLFSF